MAKYYEKYTLKCSFFYPVKRRYTSGGFFLLLLFACFFSMLHHLGQNHKLTMKPRRRECVVRLPAVTLKPLKLDGGRGFSLSSLRTSEGFKSEPSWAKRCDTTPPLLPSCGHCWKSWTDVIVDVLFFFCSRSNCSC